MKLIILTFIFFAQVASASEFTYVSFFGNNTPRTTVELLEMQKLERSDLEKYNCSVLSDKLFGLDLAPKHIADSLRIMNRDKKVVIYNKKLKSKDEFVKKVIKALKKISKLKEGKTLIKKLMHNPYPLWIKPGGNRFDPRTLSERSMFGINEAGALTSFIVNRLQVDRIRFAKWGSGGHVNWDSKKEYSAMESDGVVRGTPTFIALGHELYHAYDSIRGLLDRRMIKGESYEFQPVIEYRAVYFENLLRRSSGRLYRKYYSAPNKDVQGSMLNLKGEPRWINTDCYN